MLRRGSQRQRPHLLVGGDEIGLWSEPEMTRSLSREGGWTLDTMDTFARERLIGDLTNDFLLPDFGPKEL